MEIQRIPVIVTGGASGLGAATASSLAFGGAKVTIFDLNEAEGNALAAQIGGQFLKVDVSSEGEVEAAIAKAEIVHGCARVLVNCAGIGIPAKTVGRDGKPLALASFRKTLDVNLVGSFTVASKFAASLAQADPIGEERGVIINTASVAAFDGQMGQVAYSASKGGIVAMTLPLARDLASLRIRVVTIAPGLFMTPLLATLPKPAQESLAAQVPFPSRLGRPSEYAHLVGSIIANPMLNGETIRLDGAIRMAPR